MSLTPDSPARGNQSSYRGLSKTRAGVWPQNGRIGAECDVAMDAGKRSGRHSVTEAMNAGFGRIGLGSFVGSGEGLPRSGPAAGVWFKRGALWLLAAAVVGCAVWALMPPSEGNVVQAEPATVALARLDPLPVAATSMQSQVLPAEPAGLDRLRISSQTWRRGGLGAKALVTFTLRNDNDYAVKDVEIVCAFTRYDGTHLTDRSRVLPETVSMKSRKTFARVPVGVINVNADQAKCSVIAARRA